MNKTMTRMMMTMTALALVSGCARGAPTQNATADETSGGAASASVDIAFLTGRWAENGDCAQAREFRADGTFGPPEGSTYTLSGNLLAVNLNEPGASPGPFTVTRTGDDAMTLSVNDTQVLLTRCR